MTKPTLREAAEALLKYPSNDLDDSTWSDDGLFFLTPLGHAHRALRAALAEPSERAAALEEAALVCDAERETLADMYRIGMGGGTEHRDKADEAARCAFRIRGLALAVQPADTRARLPVMACESCKHSTENEREELLCVHAKAPAAALCEAPPASWCPLRKERA